MVSEDMDHVDKTVENKKSLLEKYDIPIEHLSYEYITQCENAKELERIIVILRSGEEGYYPDLTKHAENRLTDLKPLSTVLRVAEPVLKKDMLEPENREILENDMNEWMSEMKMREKDLDEGRAMRMNEMIPQPAVRKIMFEQPEKTKQLSQKQLKKHKRIAAWDYAGWDKYDAETELNRIDLQHNVEQAEAKRAQKIVCNKEDKMKKESRNEIVDKLALTGTELSMMAEKDREKGNEAFKAGDYEEALCFYKSSIAINPTINAYNNRAITYIKLERYDDAVNDCNKVISIDYTNIKALIRRGLALERLAKRTQALADYEAVLKIEPANKIAIGAVNKLRGPCKSKKIRMRIDDEAKTDENSEIKETIELKNKVIDKLTMDSRNRSEKGIDILSDDKASNSPLNGHNNLMEIKTNIENVGLDRTHGKEFSTSNSQIRSQICFCNNAPSSSQRSTPQPHFRDVYCPKTSQNSGKSPKTQSIFTDTKVSYGKASSVIIEEIPNEPCEKSENKENQRGKKINKEKCKTMLTKNQSKNFGNFGGGDNDMYAKKTGVFVSTDSQKNNNSRGETKIEKIIERNSSKVIKETESLTNPRRPFAKTCGVVIKEISNEEFFNTRDYSEIKNGQKILTESETISKKFFQSVQNEDDSETKDNSKKCEKNPIKGGDDLKEFSKSSTIQPNSVYKDTKIFFEKSSSVNIEDVGSTANNKINEKLNFDERTAEPKVSKTIGKTVTFATDHEENISNKSQLIDDSVSKETESATVEKTENIEFEKIESPYEFIRFWYSIRNDPHLIHHANLLKALPPENIEAVVGNKLDGDMLSLILTCFEQHYCTPENVELLNRFLQHLGQVKRFSIVRMFMDEKDKKALRNIFSFLDSQKLADRTRELRKIYDIPV